MPRRTYAHPGRPRPKPAASEKWAAYLAAQLEADKAFREGRRAIRPKRPKETRR